MVQDHEHCGAGLSHVERVTEFVCFNADVEDFRVLEVGEVLGRYADDELDVAHVVDGNAGQHLDE